MTRIATVWFALAVLAASGEAQLSDRFEGRVVAEWLENGREMKLLEDFAYHDTAGVVWKATRGSIVNGASIPRPLWSIIGGPFEGRYRNASVVHDVACGLKAQPWQAAHRMFFHASRKGGAGEIRAKIMYAAVYHFGPRWGSDTGARRLESDEDLMRMRQYIEDKPSIMLSEIENLTRAELLRWHPTIRPEMQRPPADAER